MQASITIPPEAEPSAGLDLVEPQTRAIYAYWNDKRADRLMPAPKDINPSEIRPLLPHLTILEVLEGPPLDYLYRIDGEAVRQAVGFARTGRRLSEFQQQFGPVYGWLLDCYAKLCDERTPRSIRQPMRQISRGFLTPEIVFLPLSGDGETVHRIMQCMSFPPCPEGQ